MQGVAGLATIFLHVQDGTRHFLACAGGGRVAAGACNEFLLVQDGTRHFFSLFSGMVGAGNVF